MISRINAIVPFGFEARLVEVEGDANRGLPAFNIVGMANKTINEARERVRSALTNSDFFFPEKKVTINLAPAELAKDGTYLDLPIALAVMTLSGQLIKADTSSRVFVGELSLNGEIKPVRGIINIVEEARRLGFKEIYLPIGNVSQASLVDGIRICGVDTLQNLFLTLKGQLASSTPLADCNVSAHKDLSDHSPLLDHIRGQTLAKRAMSVAVAGHHNILISGPPGAGKSLLARAAANLLPSPSPGEIIEITKLYSIAGLSQGDVIMERPFRSPHHTASGVSMIGGGADASPGEISLAHRGVLFLDEIPEFPRSVLEALRQPLEEKRITISRAGKKTFYPADFMLIATMNPCPCGYLGDPTHECNCSSTQIQNYQKKISGPLLDRIDISIAVERVSNDDLRAPFQGEAKEHNVVKNNITEAISRQRKRYGRDGVYNSSLSSYEVSQMITLEPAAEKLLATASERLNLSARAYFKTIKVARTIADLEGEDIVLEAHLAEALMYRKR